MIRLSIGYWVSIDKNHNNEDFDSFEQIPDQYQDHYQSLIRSDKFITYQRKGKQFIQLTFKDVEASQQVVAADSAPTSDEPLDAQEVGGDTFNANQKLSKINHFDLFREATLGGDLSDIPISFKDGAGDIINIRNIVMNFNRKLNALDVAKSNQAFNIGNEFLYELKLYSPNPLTTPNSFYSLNSNLFLIYESLDILDEQFFNKTISYDKALAILSRRGFRNLHEVEDKQWIIRQAIIDNGFTFVPDPDFTDPGDLVILMELVLPHGLIGSNPRTSRAVLDSIFNNSNLNKAQLIQDSIDIARNNFMEEFNVIKTNIGDIRKINPPSCKGCLEPLFTYVPRFFCNKCYVEICTDCMHALYSEAEEYFGDDCPHVIHLKEGLHSGCPDAVMIFKEGGEDARKKMLRKVALKALKNATRVI